MDSFDVMTSFIIVDFNCRLYCFGRSQHSV